MAYPEDLDSKYNLRSSNFAQGDNNLTPYDDSTFNSGYMNADESETLSVPDAHNTNWMYQILYANLRYTKDTAIENKNLLATKKATPTSLGQIKVGQGLKVLSDGTLMLENPIIGDKQSISYDIPVGMFMLWSGNTVPDTFLDPNGQSLNKSDYPELMTYANSNNLYGEGKIFYDDPTDTTNKFIIKDMRGDFIRIASGNSDICTFTQDGLPTLTVASSGMHTHSGTTDAGGVHTHNNTLSLDTGSFNLRGDSSSYAGGASTASGIVSMTKKSSNVKLFENNGGDTYSHVTGVYINPTGTLSISNSASHTHTFSISTSGEHTHTVSHGAQTRNDNKVMPANWGFKLIIKAKSSPQVRTVPIGTILDYSGAVAPTGFLKADGSTCLKSDYSDLYNWAYNNSLIKPFSQYQEGVPHSYYYEAEDSDYFIIPNLIGVYRRGETQNIGLYELDGAPNVTGSFLSNSIGSGYLSGAFSYYGSAQSPGFVSSESGTSMVINFDASVSNACYGRKEAIQPKTVIILPILKY